MEQMKSQVEFVQWLYLLKGTANSISKRAEFWAREDEASIHFGHRLMRSPLAQRLVRNLIYQSWDAVRTLRDYLGYSQQSAQLLQELGWLSSESISEDRELDILASNFHALDLNTLKLASRAMFEIVDDRFDDLFLDLLRHQIKYASDHINNHLRFIHGQLHDEFYWLGQILDDLGNVMPPGAMSPIDKPGQSLRAM